MRIADVCAFYTPHGGGVRTYVERKLAAGAALGQEIVIIAPSARDGVEERPDGGRIIHVSAPRFPLDRRYRYFADAAAVHVALDRVRPDVVEASSPWRSARFVAEWRGEAPRALVMHADPLAAYAYRWFGGIADRVTIDRCFESFWRHLRRLGAGFDVIVCASHHLARRLSNGGVAGVVSVRMGVEPGIFSPARRDEELRRGLLERCALGASADLLIGVGRHGPEKRWPMIVDAYEAASVHRPIGLVLIGEGRASVALARRVAGNPHIRLLAPIRDRTAFASLLASCDALVHGCEAETFGLAAAEAVASGLPIVVPDEGGAADLAAPGCSEVYRPADAHAATAAIRRLLALDRVAVGEAARRAATGARTLDTHFAELFDVYSGFVSASSVAA